jgi:hypothetical protein
MRSLQGINNGEKSGDDNIAIARRIFLSYKTEVFRDNEDDEFVIKNSIAKEFEISFSSIEVAGSSKTGISFFKEKLFEPGKSDLDIAVISLPLYNRFLEQAHKSTDGFSNLTVFPTFRNQRTDRQFINSLPKGYINPFFMPNSLLKSKWLNFFQKLSNKYFKTFKNINGGIYASEYFFEFKQKDCIDQYLKNKEKYDQISDSLKGAD